MYKNINEIQINKTGEIIVLIKAINAMKMKNGDFYQKVIVRDTEGNEATFMKFDGLLNIEPPAIMKLTVDCTEYGASTSVKIKSCMEVKDMPMAAFLPKAQIDIGAYWKRVTQAAKTVRPGLGRLLCSIIAAEKNRYVSLPLAPIGAFARQGGILEASVKLMEIAEKTAEIQSLDRDLMVTGALIYFNGNLDTTDEAYSNTVCDLMYGPAVAGGMKLYGHLSSLMANEEAKKDISAEDFMLLNHILISSRGRMADPCVPEAAALRLLSQALIETDEMIQTLKNQEDVIVINKNNTHRRLYNRDAASEKENKTN